MIGNDSGWQRYPSEAGLSLSLLSNPLLYARHVSHTAHVLGKYGMYDEDDYLMNYPKDHQHGHLKRTPLAMDAIMDCTGNYYNTKNSAPVNPKTKSKPFEHIDGNLARYNATAIDGRKDSELLLAVKRDIALQCIVQLTNDRGTTIELYRLHDKPDGDGDGVASDDSNVASRSVDSNTPNKSLRPYSDVITLGCTDGTYTASNSLKDQNAGKQGYKPRTSIVGEWSGDDLLESMLVFNNGLHHKVQKTKKNHGKVKNSVTQKITSICPLQPRDANGRCVGRGAAYPLLTTIMFHGPGHVSRDTSYIETFQRGKPNDAWAHVFTGNPTGKSHQAVGPSVLGPPPGSRTMQPTALARALTIAGVWGNEPRATEWILKPFLTASPSPEATSSWFKKAMEKEALLHRRAMVIPLCQDYLQRIHLISNPLLLQQQIEMQEALSTTTDNLLSGSKRVLFQDNITQRARQYYQTMQPILDKMTRGET